MLATDAGEFKLRRQGGNPFVDPLLDQLVGKTIWCDGIIEGTTFIMTSWTVED